MECGFNSEGRPAQSPTGESSRGRRFSVPTHSEERTRIQIGGFQSAQCVSHGTIPRLRLSSTSMQASISRLEVASLMHPIRTAISNSSRSFRLQDEKSPSTSRSSISSIVSNPNGVRTRGRWKFTYQELTAPSGLVVAKTSNGAPNWAMPTIICV